MDMRAFHQIHVQMVTYWRALFETEQSSIRPVIITPSSREKIFINSFSIQIQHAGRC
jgi:hypothetical protein